MSNGTPQQLNDLKDSLKSVQQLRRSASFSILLMATGITVVVGSFVYSITRLRPLEQQIAQRQMELKSAEEEFRALSDRNYELRREIENAQAQLEATQKEVNYALGKLEEVAKSPLPPNAKTILLDSISKLRGAENTVSRVETELKTSTQATPVESVPSRSQAIADLFSNRGATRLRAYNVIIDNYSADPALIPELLSYARANKSNHNGIYNTLVVLSHLNKAQLKPHAAEIRAFAREVEPIGSRIKERVGKLLSRIP